MPVILGWLLARHSPPGSRRPPGWPSGRRAPDPDGLDVAELADAVAEHLPAETGRLDAAERKLRVGGHVAVDEHHPGGEVPGEPGPFRLVAGPRVRAEAELGAVCQIGRASCRERV